MAPYRYDDYRNPYVTSIAELLQQPGQIEAQRSVAVANANARATAASGQAWAGAAANIGQIVANIPQQMQQQKRDASIDKLNALKLQEAQHSIQGRQALASAMSGAGSQIGPDDQGPRQPSFLKDEDGVSVWDLDALSKHLASSGYGDLAPELTKDIQATNQAHRDERTARLAAVSASQNVLAKSAGLALSSIRHGMDPQAAVAFQVQQLRANKTVPDEQLGPIVAQMQENPANIPHMLEALSAGGSQAPVKLGKDEQLLNPNDLTGTPIASNLVPEKPTEASLAVAAAGGDASAQEALDVMRTQKNPPNLEEQYLTAKANGDAAKADQILTTLKDTAAAKRDPAATAMAHELAGLRADEARARLEDRDVTSEKNQQKFEQQYRTVLTRAMSSRSGGIGAEDAKVQQANHLLALLDQTYDAKTGTYNIPKVLQGELAAGLARLVAPGGNVGIEMMREFNQRTAKGDIADGLTYITGTPFPSAPNEIAKMLKDSIERQGKVAEENREGEMRYLRGLAPTDLSEDRRKKLEANTLNPLRQSHSNEGAKRPLTPGLAALEKR